MCNLWIPKKKIYYKFTKSTCISASEFGFRLDQHKDYYRRLWMLREDVITLQKS